MIENVFRVDDSEALSCVPTTALDPARLDAVQFPYGATVLRIAPGDTRAVLLVKQPGLLGRTDILLIEKSQYLEIVSPVLAEAKDPRSGFGGNSRVRILMSGLSHPETGLVSSYAVVRFAVIGSRTRLEEMLASVRYTVRPADCTGWFEFGSNAFPDPMFAHGFPDIASREQTEAGIRGPSRLFVGLAKGIRPSHFHPHRLRPIEPGERIIYELHIGTFTQQGNFVSAAEQLAALATKGVTTIQLMPVDIASGSPGWTYDQARTGAVEISHYGGSEGLIHFVERAHELGLEVILDRQYNHQGPEQDSRSQFIPEMFTRDTQWGAGLSGDDVHCYPHLVKLIGEEIAHWTVHYGLDGLRLDATNRLPWEMHEQIATFGGELSSILKKPLYLLSEYAECEEPKGRRVPTGHQYADQTGRFLMKLLGLSTAKHVTGLPEDAGSVLRPMLKAARRGWWYPDVPPPDEPLRAAERSTALLWNHDWIGNRFGGERLNHLIEFALFKALMVWQFLGQWTPFLFMGTERFADTPWYFFTGHTDVSTRNNTSAYYEYLDGHLVLTGGRFHEFGPEARALGLKEPLAFSMDGTVTGIDWSAFREQKDCLGRTYMDHANEGTFAASKLDWSLPDRRQEAIETLFQKLAHARRASALKDENPLNSQYKAWSQSETVFLLRRREPLGTEFITFFNLGSGPVNFEISSGTIHAVDCGTAYLTTLRESEDEEEWLFADRYDLWLNTNAPEFDGSGSLEPFDLVISKTTFQRFNLPPCTALVFSKSMPT